eukprot:TRINITY_DN41504_c0_g1_i1.p1 TRINITY_DN41504_c0_g1~~TRINITY_DN41504_c0_g1_i1.p1  ORF type:complete len:650 (-),score=40.28 TRINITY_DN41504_c0_g1_i1:93-1949(-)
MVGCPCPLFFGPPVPDARARWSSLAWGVGRASTLSSSSSNDATWSCVTPVTCVDDKKGAGTGSLQNFVSTHARVVQAQCACHRVPPFAQMEGMHHAGNKQFAQMHWSFLWVVLVLLCSCSVLTLLPSARFVVSAVNFSLEMLCVILLSFGAYSCGVYAAKMSWAESHDWFASSTNRFSARAILDMRHIFVLPASSASVELVENTLNTIATQTDARHIAMFVFVDDDVPRYRERWEALHLKFIGVFSRLVITRCSKVVDHGDWWFYDLLQKFESDAELSDETTLITLCTPDVIFHRNYTECLTHKFLSSDDRTSAVYQSPLLYNACSGEHYFFVRVSALLRTFMLLGFLIPLSVHSEVAYSVPLSLFKRTVGDHHGGYINDMCFVSRATQAIGKRVPIHIVEVPTICCTSCRSTLVHATIDFLMQSKRRTLSAGEMFHAWCTTTLKQRCYSRSALTHGVWLTVCYAFILCSAGIMTLLQGIMQIYVASTSVGKPRRIAASLHTETFFWVSLLVQWLDVVLIGYMFLVLFGTAFVLERRFRSALKLKCDVGWLRTSLHILLAPVVYWFDCSISFLYIAMLAFVRSCSCQGRHSDVSKPAARRSSCSQHDDCTPDIVELEL